MSLQKLVLLSVLSCVLATPTLDQLATDVYITAGILGGACMLLTIATIFNIISIANMQTKLSKMQVSGKAVANKLDHNIENVAADVDMRTQEPSQFNNDNYNGQNSNHRPGPAKESYPMQNQRAPTHYASGYDNRAGPSSAPPPSRRPPPKSGGRPNEHY